MDKKTVLLMVIIKKLEKLEAELGAPSPPPSAPFDPAAPPTYEAADAVKRIEALRNEFYADAEACRADRSNLQAQIAVLNEQLRKLQAATGGRIERPGRR